MLFDNAEEKVGLTTTVDLINGEINDWLRAHMSGKPLDRENLALADEELRNWYQTKEFGPLGGPGTALIRACSEALFYASVACLDNFQYSMGQTIREHFNP